MFKRKLIYYGLSFFLLLAGCSNQRHLEDLSLNLILGLDIDKQNRLQVYVVSPVFTKESNGKEEITHVQSITLRGSREQLDERVMGMIVGSKTQVILIGQRLLQKKQWIQYLDSFYRDPQNNVNAQMVAVEGPIARVFQYNSKNKPRLSFYLTKLLTTAYQRNNTVRTSLQHFREQILEKGITPSIARLKKSHLFQINGSVLLDDNQRQRMSISSLETKWLQMLRKTRKGDFPIACSLVPNVNNPKGNHVNFSILNMHTKTKVTYNRGFHFYVDVSMKIQITEFSPLFSIQKKNSVLEKEIEKSLNIHLQRFVQKIQKHKIDPIGYGNYARAYSYPEWKNIKGNWGTSFAQSKIHIKTHVKIMGIGTIQS
ncbi:Ger(x)C family spore germination protein [Bacillus cereus]|uniref:Ger(x)C family spore germination protein n=1 Tax=Bacillus cereus TaxID=1396 RepID=UPI000994B744|nr:Ger(x)C family spore germination protein [Bacillus cereus]OPA06173.1 hypothetical protein BHL54_26985 [Bacillus cereus]